MLLEKLRAEVLDANLELQRRGLVVYTFGNVSGISRQDGLVVIKPSGVPYDAMKAEDLVITDLDGKVVEGKLRPSSDLATHLVLYRAFPELGGVVHTHSTYATAWAQSGREIPCFGTTHADYFHGSIPLTQPLRDDEIKGEYEANTGKGIVRRFEALDPMKFPGVLVVGHGPFCWGRTADDAAHMAVIMEELARMAFLSVSLTPSLPPLPQALTDKHFLRKHGPGAYYGQSK
ncbi:MAG: L-ribulose-5-phosphate 4-epimerase [Deltaproteobacteria bacterium]|nr:L-ribulose-5-phosphate 4-epimerase [Deltaproteobacteria bacterium]